MNLVSLRIPVIDSAIKGRLWRLNIACDFGPLLHAQTQRGRVGQQSQGSFSLYADLCQGLNQVEIWFAILSRKALRSAEPSPQKYHRYGYVIRH